MPPAEHAASTLVGQWGAAGAIIVGMAVMIVAGFRYFTAQLERFFLKWERDREEIAASEKAERADMRASHASERAELQRANQQNYDRALEVAKENTASNRAVEQVVRQLTGELGSIKEWSKTRQNGG